MGWDFFSSVGYCGAPRSFTAYAFCVTYRTGGGSGVYYCYCTNFVFRRDGCYSSCGFGTAWRSSMRYSRGDGLRGRF